MRNLMSAELDQLGTDLWAWRAMRQPHSGDDIPRLVRPTGWTPDFSPDGVATIRIERAEFVARWQAIDAAVLTVGETVDHRLLGSLLARVTWELDVLRSWNRDAVFHIHQALGPYYDQILPLPPFDEVRVAAIVTALCAVPLAVERAITSLTDPAGPLTRAALQILDDVEGALTSSVTALAHHLPELQRGAVIEAGAIAAESMARFCDHLSSLDEQSEAVAVGRDAFVWYLRNVALVADEPEELLVAARQEWQRALVWEQIAIQRASTSPLSAIPSTADEQVAHEAQCEQEVRDFYQDANLLTQPSSLRHYLNAALPDYVAPMGFLGVTNDLTDDDRLDVDGVSYVPAPNPELPYFYAANARDPRAGIIHEGAHYQQLALAKAHIDPIRRRYYDSGSNEGIAFYNEEMMLQAGLFDDALHTRAVVWNFARLRALRVEVDVRLATGDLSLFEAIDLFVAKVPMDVDTAFGETAFYAGNPGLALSYQIGKLHLMRLMAAAIEAQGDKFSIRSFHDYVWLNGNIPFSLLRWELLGDRFDLDRIDADPLTSTVAPLPAFSN